MCKPAAECSVQSGNYVYNVARRAFINYVPQSVYAGYKFADAIDLVTTYTHRWRVNTYTILSLDRCLSFVVHILSMTHWLV